MEAVKGEAAKVTPPADGPEPGSPSPDLVLFLMCNLLPSLDEPGVRPCSGKSDLHVDLFVLTFPVVYTAYKIFLA